MGNNITVNAENVLREYENKVSHVVSSFRSRANAYGISCDDLSQECRIVVWESCKNVQPFTESFDKYITTAMKRKVRDILIEKSSGMSRRNFDYNGMRYVSIDEQVESVGFDGDISEECVSADSIENDAEVRDFIEYCEAYDKTYGYVLKCMMDGKSSRKIASSIHIDHKTVACLMNDIRKFYNEYTNGEGGKLNVDGQHTTRDRRVRRTSLRRVPHKR